MTLLQHNFIYLFPPFFFLGALPVLGLLNNLQLFHIYICVCVCVCACVLPSLRMVYYGVYLITNRYKWMKWLKNSTKSDK